MTQNGLFEGSWTEIQEKVDKGMSLISHLLRQLPKAAVSPIILLLDQFLPTSPLCPYSPDSAGVQDMLLPHQCPCSWGDPVSLTQTLRNL